MNTDTQHRSDEPNRRSGRRHALRQPATLVTADGTSRAVTVWDLGLDGMSVLSPRPVPPGTRCEVRFALPPGGDAVEAAAKSVYSSFVGPAGFRVGLVFTQLPDLAAEAIARFADAAG